MKFNSFLFEKEQTLQFHKELQPDIWTKEKDKYILKEPIRKKLLEISEKWMEFANIPKKHVKNILFTGSLANYNFTNLSDIDLHILVDYDSISKDFDFLYDYFKDKKQIWGENHEITIKGFPVELYAQPMSEKPHTNQGVYSVSSNKWIQEPKPVEIDIEGDAVFMKKLQSFKEQIDDIIEGKGTVKNIEKFKEKIRKMRNAAIAKSGEFSQENLIFKSLRNLGYLEKLSNYHKEVVDKSLSLESIKFDVVEKAKSLKDRANILLDENYKAKEEHTEEDALTMDNIKIGDRVRYIGTRETDHYDYNEKLIKNVGTYRVKDVFSGDRVRAGIEWDNYINGHILETDGIPHSKDGHGWFVDIKFLERA